MAMASDAARPTSRAPRNGSVRCRSDELPEGLRGEPREALDLDERAVVLDAYATLPNGAGRDVDHEGRGPPAWRRRHRARDDARGRGALAARARDQLRQRLPTRQPPPLSRPAVRRPHPSRWRDVRHGGRDGPAPAAAAHVDGCSSCRALVVAVGAAPRLFAWLSSRGPRRRAARARPRPRRRARPARDGVRGGATRSPVATAAMPGARTGRTVAHRHGAVAAALVVAVLARCFLPAARPTEVASPSPRPRRPGGLVVPRPHRPPALTVARPARPCRARRGADRPIPRRRRLPPFRRRRSMPTSTREPRGRRPRRAPSRRRRFPRCRTGAPHRHGGNDDVIDAVASPSVPSVSSAVCSPPALRWR